MVDPPDDSGEWRPVFQVGRGEPWGWVNIVTNDVRGNCPTTARGGDIYRGNVKIGMLPNAGYPKPMPQADILKTWWKKNISKDGK